MLPSSEIDNSQKPGTHIFKQIFDEVNKLQAYWWWIRSNKYL